MPTRPGARPGRRVGKVALQRLNMTPEERREATERRRRAFEELRSLLNSNTKTVNYPTQVNPNKGEHWTGLSKDERTLRYDRWGRTLNSGGDAPMPRYVTSRRDYDGREQVERTHAQRYRDLRAAFNVT